MELILEANVALRRILPPRRRDDIHVVQHEKKYLLEWHESQGGEEGLRNALKKDGQMKMCAYDTAKILDEGILDDIFNTM